MTSTANVANETSSCYLAENFNQNNDERNVNVENNSKTNSRVDPVTASVTNRKWIKTPYGSNFHPRHNAHIFKLMSYNILSQDLLNIHSDLYIENDPNALKWEHRLKCLTHEILSVEPDILCLQEVQYTHLNDIVEALRPLNFAEPLYKRRNGPQVDGCAIFYNKTMFKLLDRHYVEYYQPNVEVNNVIFRPKFVIIGVFSFFQILDRYNVAVIVKLALASKPDCEFVVSTTHLLYNPRRDDIRLAQVQVLLAELDRLSYHTKKSSPLPIILTGDFNFQSCSEAYQLITSGSVKLHYNYNRDCVHRLLPDILGITDNCQHLNVAVKNQRDQTLVSKKLYLSSLDRSDIIISLF